MKALIGFCEEDPDLAVIIVTCVIAAILLLLMYLG